MGGSLDLACRRFPATEHFKKLAMQYAEKENVGRSGRHLPHVSASETENIAPRLVQSGSVFAKSMGMTNPGMSPVVATANALISEQGAHSQESFSTSMSNSGTMFASSAAAGRVFSSTRVTADIFGSHTLDS